jgi:hypothetical protein
MRDIALVAAVLTCGCKSNLVDRHWSRAEACVIPDPGTAEGDRPYLGVVVQGEEPGYRPMGHGASVLRLLTGSPAEACGLHAGDVITRFGARRLEQAGDLAAAVRGASAGTPVELTVRRGGQELQVTARIGRWADHMAGLQPKLEAQRDDQEGKACTGLYHGGRVQVEADDWLAWCGQRLIGPYVLYDDDDVLPLLGLGSLFRFETMPSIGAWDFDLFTWPLELGSSGADTDREYLRGLLAEGEETLEVL